MFQNTIEKQTYHTVGPVPTVWYVCFSIVCSNCSDGMVCLFFYCMLDLFRQCSMFVFLLYVGTVPTVWYVCFSIVCWKCSDGVVCLFFLLYVGTVPTVWYVCFSIVYWHCSDGVVCLFFY